MAVSLKRTLFPEHGLITTATNLSTGTSKPQDTVSPQFKLLSLPLELRREIYKSIFNRRSIYIHGPHHANPYEEETNLTLTHSLQTPPLPSEDDPTRTHFVLAHPHIAFFKPQTPTDGGPEYPEKLPMAFLHTSHQICNEASDMLYLANAFFFDDPVVFSKFTTVIGSQHRASLKTIYLKIEQFLTGLYDKWTAVLSAPYVTNLHGLTRLVLLIVNEETYVGYRALRQSRGERGMQHKLGAFAGFEDMGLSEVEVIVDGTFYAPPGRDVAYWTEEDRRDYARCILRLLGGEELEVSGDDAQRGQVPAAIFQEES